jgi:hypothetical protein
MTPLFFVLAIFQIGCCAFAQAGFGP